MAKLRQAEVEDLRALVEQLKIEANDSNVSVNSSEKVNSSALTISAHSRHSFSALVLGSVFTSVLVPYFEFNSRPVVLTGIMSTHQKEPYKTHVSA